MLAKGGKLLFWRGCLGHWIPRRGRPCNAYSAHHTSQSTPHGLKHGVITRTAAYYARQLPLISAGGRHNLLNTNGVISLTHVAFIRPTALSVIRTSSGSKG